MPSERIEYIAINTVDLSNVADGTDARPPTAYMPSNTSSSSASISSTRSRDPADRVIHRDQILRAQRRQLWIRGPTHPHSPFDPARNANTVSRISAPC